MSEVLYYFPNDTMRLETYAYPTNQVGTIGVRLVNLDTRVATIARTTVGIQFDAATGSHWIDTLVSPAVIGEYDCIFDVGETPPWPSQRVVISSASSPTTVGGGVIVTNNISDRIRRAVRDYPARDVLFQSMDVGDTTISVTNPGVGYAPGQVIVIDAEAMLVTSTASSPDAGATFDVQRGWMGTGNSVHSASSPVLIGVRFAPTDILDAMNEGMRMLWPYFFKMTEDTTLTITDQLQSDYPLPTVFGASGLVTSMEILLPSLPNSYWSDFRWFRHREGAGGRTLQLIRVPPPGTQLRLLGMNPFSEEFDFTGANPSAQMTDHAVAAIVLYAKYALKMVDEAARQNIATAKNIGPAAVQGGQNSNLAQMYFQQWQSYCQSHAQRYPRWRTRRTL